jgi:HSP20 family protein
MNMQIRWTPFNELARLQGDLDRFFGADGDRHSFNPAFDVVEDASSIVLEADLPGVAEGALDLQIEDGVLTIKGERTLQRPEPQGLKAGEHRRFERPQGTFSRAFKLPPTVDGAKISAQLKDGVLKVVLPKRPEAQPHKIKVSVNS